jgi:hypothetical protein
MGDKVKPRELVWVLWRREVLLPRSETEPWFCGLLGCSIDCPGTRLGHVSQSGAWYCYQVHCAWYICDWGCQMRRQQCWWWWWSWTAEVGRQGRECIDVCNICDFRKVQGSLRHQEAGLCHVAVATQILTIVRWTWEQYTPVRTVLYEYVDVSEVPRLGIASSPKAP